MVVKSPSWKITNIEECKEILSRGIAEGMTEVIVRAQKGYEISE